MTGFVYILKTGAFAKVGYSRNPDQRLAQLQVNLPEPSKIIARFPGTRSLEYIDCTTICATIISTMSGFSGVSN